MKKNKEEKARKRKKKLIKLCVFLGLALSVVIAWKNRRRIAARLIERKLPDRKKRSVFTRILLRKLKKRR